MAEKMNIYSKLLAITAEMNTVAKNLKVQQTKTSSYQAVSERDVLDAVKPLEAKYGIYSYPAKRTVLESNILESESTFNNTTTKKTTFMTRIETVYRFVNTDNPDEFIETTVFSEGIDTQDKGSGKAMTYADKYALMKAYKISTGDDPDKDPSNEENYKPRNKQNSKGQPESKPSDTTIVNELYAVANEHGFSISDVTKLSLVCYNKKPMELEQKELKNLKAAIIKNPEAAKEKIGKANEG